jgi:transporter family-2 protein
MTLLWPMALALFIGFALSQQPVINGATAQVLGSPLPAAALSLSLSAIIVIVATLVSGATPQAEQVFSLPWWALLGGVIGALFVAGGATLVPITGAAVFFTCLIAGQLIGAVLADAIGAFGIQERAVSARKLFGVALAFAGVFLVRWG